MRLWQPLQGSVFRNHGVLLSVIPNPWRWYKEIAEKKTKFKYIPTQILFVVLR